MSRPKNNNFRLSLSEDKTVVQLTVSASSREKAIELYEKLEQAILEMMRADLELDWQEDNPDSQ
ncbi:MAG: hypothetical protein RMY64_19455 [Nostoc sp. DedQUE08]|uniref:hypothetical protein n=1 Tax=unclassified Nostoc TaxID=2593658 RepID=UPI002AD44D5D|nr:MULTISPECIES: hypothetical protein [unclassified Nostoc]MDZ8067769.1 hypothetical protein [Nostoc sp. DedQUE08]MDZ8095939.1 hypothetical protein [Nostoc sp. DedQUE05]